MVGEGGQPDFHIIVSRNRGINIQRLGVFLLICIITHQIGRGKGGSRLYIQIADNAAAKVKANRQAGHNQYGGGSCEEGQGGIFLFPAA